MRDHLPVTPPSPLPRGSLRREDDATRAALAQAVLDSVDVGIVACDADARLTVFNRVSREFHGQPADASIAEADLAARFDLYRADGCTPLTTDEIPLLRALREGEVHDLEIVVAPHDRPRRLVSCTGRAILGAHGEVTGAVIAMRDVTDQRAATERLRDNALRDPLTGLPNRLWLFQQVTHELSALAAGSGTMALLFIDLDGFKLVNDVYGHARGDILLAEAAARLSEVASGSEQVARLGGDEFVLICPGISADNRDHPSELARRVVDALSQPFRVHTQTVRLSASVGIAFADDEDDLTSEQLVARADAAMYAAKTAGRNRWATHSPHTITAARASSRIENLLRESLDTGTFEVHYQPIHFLRDRTIRGVEALARLPDGDGGYIPPDDFIPVAERTGLIGRVGEAVLLQATHEVAQWKLSLGEREFGLGVNLSVRELSDPGLVLRMKAALALSGLDPQALVMELTESVFSDSDEHNLVLDELQGLGLKLAIDDFGTGHSSLSYLRRFGVDGLKIDRTFVADIAPGRDHGVTEAIVSMTLHLGAFVIPEGIETEEQRSALMDMGCQLGQGFLLSRPMPASEITALLAAEHPPA